MGYMMLIAPCLVCGRLFASNPRRVPNIQGEPVCKDCMKHLNQLRKEEGPEPWFVPDDAYKPEECL